MFDEIGDRVFRRRYESLDLNIGVVVGEDEVLVIDTRASHRQADELRAELAALTALPVRHLVNTHWHWDHVWGNARFPEGTITGHANCLPALIERGEEARRDVLAWMPDEHHPAVLEVEIVPPSETLTAMRDIVVGGRTVELRHHGRGHTDADLVIHVPDAGVTFMGDLIEEGAPPSFGDSYPLEWPITLDVILPTLQSVVVPGHGDVVDRAFVESQRDELAVVADRIREIAAGVDRAAALDQMPYPEEVAGVAMERAISEAAPGLHMLIAGPG